MLSTSSSGESPPPRRRSLLILFAAVEASSARAISTTNSTTTQRACSPAGTPGATTTSRSCQQRLRSAIQRPRSQQSSVVFCNLSALTSAPRATHSLGLKPAVSTSILTQQQYLSTSAPARRACCRLRQCASMTSTLLVRVRALP